MRIVGPVVQTELEGNFRLDWNLGSLVCELLIPLSQVVANY